MGVDILEDSDYAALSQSRCGNSFIDDNRYVNFSIVSKKEKARRTASDKEVVDRTWRIDESFKNNCDYLNMRLKSLQNEINSLRQQNKGQTFTDRTLTPMIQWETIYKNELIRLRCEENELERKKKEDEENIVRTLKDVTNAPPPMLPPDVAETKGSNTNQYIIYGVGGLFLVIILVAVLK
jgi:seryl-tRNA synthetase